MLGLVPIIHLLNKDCSGWDGEEAAVVYSSARSF